MLHLFSTDLHVISRTTGAGQQYRDDAVVSIPSLYHRRSSQTSRTGQTGRTCLRNVSHFRMIAADHSSPSRDSG